MQVAMQRTFTRRAWRCNHGRNHGCILSWRFRRAVEPSRAASGGAGVA